MPNVKIRQLWGWLPMGGLALGNTVFLKNKNDALTLAHELVHVAQQAKLGWRFWASYLFLLPFGWNPWRKELEAEAYAVQARAGVPIEELAAVLAGSMYGWCCRNAQASAAIRRFVVLALIPFFALSQGLTTNAPGVTGGGKVLASFPLTTSGALIEEDANTVAHVYFNGTALVDTKGNAWTMNGTVPQVSANPFTTTRYGAGPFSNANYYSLGTGSDVLDFAGDFTACVVYSGSVVADQNLISNGVYGASGAGWGLNTWTSNRAYFVTNDVSSQTTQSTMNNVPDGVVSVVCAGRSSTTQYAKANLATTVSTAGSKLNPGTSQIAKIGYATGAFVGTIYEVYATTTPFTEATVVAIQEKVLGHFDGYAPLAVTRATNATYENPAGTVWTVPAGVARITTDGLLVEPARTNYVRQSNTMSTGTALTSPWQTGGVTVTTVAGAPVGGTWTEATGGGISSQMWDTPAPASTTTLVGSVWMAKASGTGYASVSVRCGAVPSACTCLRSDGGSCAASIGRTFVNDCDAEVADLGTTPVRVSAIVTCPVAITSSIFSLQPGRHGVSTGTTRFSGAQLEVGTYPTSLIVTTTTATARNADLVIATVPAVTGGKACYSTTVTGPAGISWTTLGSYDARFWSLGAENTANSFKFRPTLFDSYDAAVTRKYWAFAAPAGLTTVPIRATVCVNGGTPTVTIDGVVPTLTPGGTGVPGFNPTLTTMYFGNRDLGTLAVGYILKNLKICAAKNAKECK